MPERGARGYSASLSREKLPSMDTVTPTTTDRTSAADAPLSPWSELLLKPLGGTLLFAGLVIATAPLVYGLMWLMETWSGVLTFGEVWGFLLVCSLISTRRDDVKMVRKLKAEVAELRSRLEDHGLPVPETETETGEPDEPLGTAAKLWYGLVGVAFLGFLVLGVVFRLWDDMPEFLLFVWLGFVAILTVAGFAAGLLWLARCFSWPSSELLEAPNADHRTEGSDRQPAAASRETKP